VSAQKKKKKKKMMMMKMKMKMRKRQRQRQGLLQKSVRTKRRETQLLHRHTHEKGKPMD